MGFKLKTRKVGQNILRLIPAIVIPQLTNDAQCAPDTMSECAAVWCHWARQVQGVERVAGLKNAK